MKTENYKTVRLGDVCEIAAGQGAPQGDSNYCNDGTPFVKAGNLIELIEGKLENQIQKVSEEVANSHKLKKYSAGSILFAKSGMSCMKGYVYQLKNDSYVVSHLAIVKPKEDSSDYIEYCLRHIKPNTLVKDEAYPSISLQDISNLQIPLPPLATQKHIAAVLDKCTALIAKHREMLEKYDTLIKSQFVEMFGDPETNNYNWKKQPIGENCFVTKLAGFEYSKYIHYSDTGDVVMVKAQNVKNGKLNEKDMSYISKAVSDALPRSQLIQNDVVLTYVGANIGDVALIDDKHKYHLAPNVAKIRPDTKVYNSLFLVHLLLQLKMYIVRNSADTAKAAIGMEKIRQLIIPVPPSELQNDFAAFVRAVDAQKAKAQESLEKAETLYKAMMQEYFG